MEHRDNETTSSMAGGNNGRTTSRNTPYPYPRRASAPNVPLMSPLSPLVGSHARPSMRSSNTSTGAGAVTARPRDLTAAAATQPMMVSHGSHLAQSGGLASSNSNQLTAGGGSLPSSLPSTLSSSSPFITPTSRHISVSGGSTHHHQGGIDSTPLLLSSSYGSNNTGHNNMNTLTMTSSSLPSSAFHTSSFYNIHDDTATNQYTEHWQVTSKEAAKQITDLSDMMSMDQGTIVTFYPHSYILVHRAEVGSHNWFRAQACTCETYRGGFDKVRRPATIRDHLAKQVCAPASLARLAELQLRMMRSSSSKRHSHASASDISNSPRLAPLPEYQQHQSTHSGYPTSPTMPSLSSGNGMPLSATQMPFPYNAQSGTGALQYPASPSLMPMPLPGQLGSSLQTYSGLQHHHYQIPGHYNYGFSQWPAYHQHESGAAGSGQDNLETSRSWPSSTYHHGVSSPFFGWSTDSEHAPSSASMSTNNSDLGSHTSSSSSAGGELSLGLGFSSLTMSHGPASPSPRFAQAPTSAGYVGQHYSLGSALYGGGSGGFLQGSGSSMAGGSQAQAMFNPSPKDLHNSDSPLFGESESLFTFDDM